MNNIMFAYIIYNNVYEYITRLGDSFRCVQDFWLDRNNI